MADSPRSRRPPKAVIFDLDDTLIDSFDARRHALEKVFRLAGIQAPSAHEFLTGLGGRQLFGALETLAPGLHIGGTSLSEAYRDFYWSKEPGLLRPIPWDQASSPGPPLVRLWAGGLYAKAPGVRDRWTPLWSVQRARRTRSGKPVLSGSWVRGRGPPQARPRRCRARPRPARCPREGSTTGRGQCRGHRGGQSSRMSELLCHLGHTRRRRSPQHLAGLCRKIPGRAALPDALTCGAIHPRPRLTKRPPTERFAAQHA